MGHKKNQGRNEVKAARLARAAENHKILITGKCPLCGTKLYRNLSLTGWWQCGHLGAVGFQKEPGPHCDFDLFYDVTPDEHAQILEQEAMAAPSFSGRLIEGLIATVAKVERPTCRWESPETHYAACDGGEPCGRPAVGDTECCSLHQEEHSRDSDCSLGPDDLCITCHVYHGDPCQDCGGRGYHTSNCAEMRRGAILREGLKRVGCPVL
jgi:hypothetical protein